MIENEGKLKLDMAGRTQWPKSPNTHGAQMQTSAFMLLKENHVRNMQRRKDRLDPGEGGAGGAGASSNRCPGTILGLDLKFHKNCVWTISS